MYAGIDVSKNWVDVALVDGERLRRASPSQAAAWLAERAVTLAVLEATGGYERSMLAALAAAGVGAARVNPRQSRQFGGALGLRSKTDAVDAHLLARYGAMMQPKALPAPSVADAVQARLQALLARRHDVVTMRTAEKNRLQQTTDDWLRTQIMQMIAQLETQCVTLETQLRQMLAQDAALAARVTRWRTVPGIGLLSALALAAWLPELGNASREEIAALVGVAPYTRASGQWQGKAFCSGGRAPLRQMLYMAALSASRGEQRFARRYREFVARGKPRKVALVAILRQMLTTLNAMERTQTDFIT
jgi:transposase